MLTLYIGNKNYSSWSLRPWLLMTHSGIAFEEVRLRLSSDPLSAFKQTLSAITPTGRVPVLVDDGFAVWDTLAIIEYLAERFPEIPVWPRGTADRARARSLCAEMHAGFSALRSAFPMNVEASLPEVGSRCVEADAGVASDLRRIDEMWSAQLKSSGGPFLFGGFCAADAYYAPVCCRFRTYHPPLSEASSSYVERVLTLPGMSSWCAAARLENDFVADDEPYRTEPP